MPQYKQELTKAIIALLLRVQAADNKTHLREFAYIHKVAKHLGLSVSDVIAIEKHLDDYPLQPPSDEKERMTILYYLLFLMQIDGECTEEEQYLVEEFGLRLGFRVALTKELISTIRKYSDTRIPHDALLQQIRKYLN